MNSALKMMNFVLEMVNSAFKMVSFMLKMMDMYIQKVNKKIKTSLIGILDDVCKQEKNDGTT